jgi:hypothetical protein
MRFSAGRGLAAGRNHPALGCGEILSACLDQFAGEVDSLAGMKLARLIVM